MKTTSTTLAAHTHRSPRLAVGGWVGALLALALLQGCASNRLIDSDVRSFAGATAAVIPATYRFERLPSQTAAGAAHDGLEAMAQTVLQAKGLQRDDARARYSLQLKVDREHIASDPLYRWESPFFSHRIVIGPYGPVWLRVRPQPLERDWYRHTVQVLMRDVQTGAPVFESRAVHDGPWSDSANLLAPMLEAALHDYPQGQAKGQTITVNLPAANANPR